MVKKIFSVILLAIMLVGIFIPNFTFAAGDAWRACDSITDPDVREAAGCDETETVQGKIDDLYNVLIAIVGFISGAAIVIGGVFMTTSAGDAGKVAKGKNAVIYGIVGLVVSILAWAIINFVLSL